MTKSYRTLDYATLKKIAAKYKTKREFFDDDPSAFVSASRKKVEVKDPETGDMKEVSVLSQICTHMFTGRFKWTKSMVLNIAKGYKTRTAFAEGDRAAYSAATRYKWLKEACAHMQRKQRSDKGDKRT